MAKLSHQQGRLVKELVDEIVQTINLEHDVFLSESTRIKTILAEAAQGLRQNFKVIDGIVREAVDQPSEAGYSEAYRSIVATLQFEDIVDQIISHHIERAQKTSSVLEAVSGVLEDSLNDSEMDQEALLSQVRESIGSQLGGIAVSQSVRQQNLASGEVELF